MERALKMMGAQGRQIVQIEQRLAQVQADAAALQDSEKRYRRLFESAKDGILILDADTGRIVDANPFLLQLLGYTIDEMRGEHIWDIGMFKDVAASLEAFRTLQDNEYIRYDDLPLETRDGRPISVEFVSNVYPVDQVKVIQCNIRDITARKRADAEHKRLMAAVEQIGEAIVMTDAAGRIVNHVSVGRDITDHLQLTAQFQQAQKMESVGLLAGGVAHDYNNMLGVILGNAELAMQEAEASGPLRMQLEEIHKAAMRSAEITRQLLTFARKQAIAPVALDLNRNIEGMITMLQRLIGEDINLTWQPGADLWPVSMDPVQIGQVLANLCVNARDAIADVGGITIETGNVEFDEAYSAHNPGYAAGQYVMLEVGDNGSGMAPEMLDQIFEPFFSSKELGRGTGLGLSTVYGIVKQNDGFINVRSAPGQGTTFRIYLRRHEGGQVATAPNPIEDLPRGRGETVLVVEDEPALLELAETMLTRLGYGVLAAATPTAAIAMAAQHQCGIRVLLTDLVMPEMNGRSLATRLQADRPEMGILFMSGHTPVSEAGVDCLQKPFTTRDLAVRVRGLIDRLSA